MSFQDLEAGPVRGAPRRNGWAGGGGASQAVASGVFQINTAVATFQRLVNTLGTPKDTPDLRDRMCVAYLPRSVLAVDSQIFFRLDR
jgi:syntaxin 7